MLESGAKNSKSMQKHEMKRQPFLCCIHVLQLKTQMEASKSIYLNLNHIKV